VKHNNNLG